MFVVCSLCVYVYCSVNLFCVVQLVNAVLKGSLSGMLIALPITPVYYILLGLCIQD
ncbi:hypothetical protein Sjap_011211 [Stephania japonica]|uniref:Uncharacterized protein n=1 Tax=Stephania japonica TaxID=461633 RepID=A0AAP0JAZ9_9MAGN